MRLNAAVGVIAVAAALGACARPDDRRRALRGGAVAAGVAAHVVLAVALDDQLGADACRWCEPNRLDAGAREALRWSDPRLADRVSDATAFYLAPLAGFGLLAVATRPDRDVRRFLDDALPVAETAIAATLLHHLVKVTVDRQRPRARHGEPGRAPEVDDNMSFYSGHTQTAFAVVTAAGTVARLRDHPVEPWIWWIGLPLAGATGYLRIAADQHYLVDVAAGALIGSAAGLLLPRLLVGDHDGVEPAVIIPAPGGIAVVGHF